MSCIIDKGAKRMRILIVDDDPNNRMLLKRMLSPYGHCDLVINGQEAVDAYELALTDGHPYRFACLDIMMPEMDGQEALKRIRRLEQENGLDGPDASVIFMTSALDTELQVVKAFFHGGCTDYLSKPLTKGKMLAKMREYRLLPE